MTITCTAAETVPADATVVGVPVTAGPDGPTLVAGAGPDPDVAYLARRGFEAGVGETMTTRTPAGTTVIAVGVGPAGGVEAETLRRAAAALARAARTETTLATTLVAAAPTGLDAAEASQAVAEGLALGSYAFTRYRSNPKATRLERVTAVGADGAVATGQRIAEAVALARDLVNEPAGSLPPAGLAEVATDIAERAGLELEVLDEHALAEAGMGGILGVAAGSAAPPRLIRLTYDPGGAAGARYPGGAAGARSPGGAAGAPATVALVGKGITFDSGGLSIKSAEGMEAMKTDMSGAAAVLGVMSALADLGVGTRVVGIVPAAENMPGGRATRPGDVLRIRNGTTVEVLNTDAEGRLVLADGLSLAAEEGVDAIIDLATLTGACVVALGKKVAGLMGNHPGWINQVHDAATRAGEAVWPLPLPVDYRKGLESEIADLRNIGRGRWGGALTAGLFLKEFVGDVAWAHLDIAGPARSDDDEGYLTKGGTGFGVRTVLEVLRRFQRPG